MMNHLNIAFALFVVTNLPFLTLSKVTNDPKDPILDFAPPISMDLSLLDDRIYNGSEVNITEASFMAAIFKNGQYHCSGSFIAQNVILTAAHCVYKVKTKLLSVVIGVSDIEKKNKTKMKIKSFKQNPKFTTNNAPEDIALIKLKKAASSVKLIELPSKGSDNDTCSQLTAYGFGESSKKKKTYALRSTQVSKAKCPKKSNKVICTAAKTGQVCLGDSGGPLVTKANGKDVVIGVLSQVVGSSECGTSSKGLYTLVSSHLDWIKKELPKGKRRYLKKSYY